MVLRFAQDRLGKSICLLAPQVLHVDVGAQSDVVGEIPARVVGIVIDDDVVAVPIPVVDVSQVKRSNAEVEAAKPEAVGPPPPMRQTWPRPKPPVKRPCSQG